MGKIIFDILEDDFTKRSSPTFELSILTGIDSFTYMVSDGQQNILALREYLLDEKNMQDFQQTLESDRLLALQYRNSRIVWVGDLSTLIPGRLLNNDDRQILLGHLTDVPENTLLKNDQLTPLSAVNVYGIEEARWNMLKGKFPGARLFHIHTALFWGYRKYAAQQGGMQVFVHVRPSFFHLLIFDGSNLLLANRYAYQSAKDFLYFILLIFDQFKLSQENTPLLLSGKLLSDSEIYRLLARYIRQLDFLKPPAFFQFGPKMTQKKHYFYFDLFCGLLCK